MRTGSARPLQRGHMVPWRSPHRRSPGTTGPGAGLCCLRMPVIRNAAPVQQRTAPPAPPLRLCFSRSSARRAAARRRRWGVRVAAACSPPQHVSGTGGSMGVTVHLPPSNAAQAAPKSILGREKRLTQIRTQSARPVMPCFVSERGTESLKSRIQRKRLYGPSLRKGTRCRRTPLPEKRYGPPLPLLWVRGSG